MSQVDSFVMLLKSSRSSVVWLVDLVSAAASFFPEKQSLVSSPETEFFFRPGEDAHFLNFNLTLPNLTNKNLATLLYLARFQNQVLKDARIKKMY